MSQFPGGPFDGRGGGRGAGDPWASVGGGDRGGGGSGGGRSGGAGPVPNAELACLNCGTWLRGVPAAGQCPRCGLAAEATRGEPPLGVEYGYVLANLQSGARWIVWTALMNVGFMVSLMMAALVMGVMSGAANSSRGASSAGPPMPFNSAGYAILFVGGSLVLSVLQLLAYWKFSTPGPTPTALDRSDSARQRIRTIYLIIIASWFVSAPLSIAGGVMGPGTPLAVSLASWVISIAGLGLHAALLWSVMQFVVPLAARLPDPALASRAYRYRWLLPLLATVGMLPCGIGALVGMVMYLLFLWEFQGKVGRLMSNARWTPAIMEGLE